MNALSRRAMLRGSAASLALVASVAPMAIGAPVDPFPDLIRRWRVANAAACDAAERRHDAEEAYSESAGGYPVVLCAGKPFASNREIDQIFGGEFNALLNRRLKAELAEIKKRYWAGYEIVCRPLADDEARLNAIAWGLFQGIVNTPVTTPAGFAARIEVALSVGTATTDDYGYELLEDLQCELQRLAGGEA